VLYIKGCLPFEVGPMSFSVKNYSVDEVLQFIKANEQYSMISLLHHDYGFNISDMLDSMIQNPITPQSIKDTANQMCHAEWIRDW
jgi:hypothetical protein